MLDWLFRRRSLEEMILKPRLVVVHGIRFKIRKLDPFDYMAGSKAMVQEFSTYEVRGAADMGSQQAVEQIKKIKAHYADVFMAAVLSPALKRKKDEAGEGLPVEHLFTDWGLANDLYTRIMEHTYGKKNFSRLVSAASASSK
jgi:hypothetical protein